MRDGTVEVMFRAILDATSVANDRLARIETRLDQIADQVAGVRLELATHDHGDDPPV